MSLEFKVVGREEQIAKLKGVSEKVVASVTRTIHALGLELTQHVIQDKLHGQVLGQRSGRLARSIHPEFTDTSTGSTAKVGTNVVYAAIQEYGGAINHPGGTAFFIDIATGLARFVPNANALSETLPRTKPHVIPMPERSFLRSALSEMHAEIVSRLTQAANLR